MHAFKIDLMTVLVLAVILGVILTMSLGTRTEAESIGAIDRIQGVSGSLSMPSGTQTDLVEKVTFHQDGILGDHALSSKDGMLNNPERQLQADQTDPSLI